jgi:hypothetical protein
MSTTFLLSSLCLDWNLASSAAFGHRDSSSSACPLLNIVASDRYGLGSLAAAMVDGSLRVFTFQRLFDVIVKVSDSG